LLSLQADIEGLQMFISLAEEKQMQFFNPPKVTPEVFEKTASLCYYLEG
jgi:hypothetical protein